MSEQPPSSGTGTFPTKIGDWEADARVWMNVGCNLEFAEAEGLKVLKITPLSDMMNFSIWKNAAKYETLDLEESQWKSFAFAYANHLSDLESVTLSLYHDLNFWEKDILPDLATGDWKTLEYLLPSASPEGFWKEVGSPTNIKYILFKFSGKSGKLSGSFEIKKAHLVRASPKT
jgi:hypothetical protein